MYMLLLLLLSALMAAGILVVVFKPVQAGHLSVQHNLLPL